MANEHEISFDSIVAAQKRAAVNAELAKVAQEQLQSMFFDVYMVPGDFGDVKYRVGDVVGTTGPTVESKIDTSSFAPYYHDSSTRVLNAPYRAGGFMGINNLINRVQRINKNITGQIRTKLTEWDVSMYLQDNIGTGVHIGILHGLKDKASIDREGLSPAFMTKYAIVNASVSPWRTERWDPSLDSDIKEWVPPTNNFNDREACETAEHFYDYDLVHTLQWTSWYPPFWQIFHLSENMDGLGDLDSSTEEYDATGTASTSSDKKWLSALRGKGKAISQGERLKDSIGSGAGGLKGTNNIGVSGLSPFLYGRPYGRYRAFSGLINDQLLSSDPVLAPTAETWHPYNRHYVGKNPVKRLNMLKEGWSEGVSTPSWKQETVKVPLAVHKSPWSWAYGWWGWLDRYLTVWVDKLVWRRSSSQTYEAATSIPLAKGSIQILSNAEIANTGWDSFNASSRRANGNAWVGPGIPLRLTNLNTEAVNALKHMISSPYSHYKSYGYTFRSTNRYNLDPSKVNSRPVLFVSQDRNTVVIAHISYGLRAYETYYTTSRRKWFRKRRYTTHTLHHQEEIIWVSSQASLFCTNLNNKEANNQFAPMGNSTFSYLMDRIKSFSFEGMYLKIDDLESIVGPGLDTKVIQQAWTEAYGEPGIAIARAFTSTPWKYNGIHYKVTLHKLFYDIYHRYKPAKEALLELAELFETIDSQGIENLIAALPSTIQGLQSVKEAQAGLSNLDAFLQQVTNLTELVTNLLILLEPMETSCSEDLLTVAVITQGYEYQVKIDAIMNSGLIQQVIADYLTILYEWRAIIVAARMNKSDGTLVLCGRMEKALELIQDQQEDKPHPLDATLTGVLSVVHVAGTVSMGVTAKAKKEGIEVPIARVKKLYVKVEYDEDRNIIYPESGTYKLSSTERTDYIKLHGTSEATETQFHITFNELDHPKIIHNVMKPGIDLTVMSKLMYNHQLTDLEKVCASRTIEDWWEIPIKLAEIEWPLKSLYQTNVTLARPSDVSKLQSTINAIGGAVLSPVLEHVNQAAVGASDATQLAYKINSLS